MIVRENKRHAFAQHTSKNWVGFGMRVHKQSEKPGWAEWAVKG
jgi:hypothetical protein